MYTRAYWEDVNSIKGSYTSVIDPNLTLYCVMLMYTDVQRWTIIMAQRKRREDLPSRALCICCHSPSGSSAGRGALLALHPLLEGGFRVADGAANLT